MFSVTRFVFVFLSFSLVGCSTLKPGSRTLSFGPDGVTVASETLTMNQENLTEMAREKTRQVCYREHGKLRAKMVDLSTDNPIIMALIAQADALNNAFSLMSTGKQFDPCPSSTNINDVAIAETKMYSNVWDKAFSFLKFGIGAWAGTEIVDSLSGFAGGYSLAAVGDGSTVNVYDSFKSSWMRDGNTFGGNLQSNPTVTEFLPVE